MLPVLPSLTAGAAAATSPEVDELATPSPPPIVPSPSPLGELPLPAATGSTRRAHAQVDEQRRRERKRRDVQRWRSEQRARGQEWLQRVLGEEVAQGVPVAVVALDA